MEWNKSHFMQCVIFRSFLGDLRLFCGDVEFILPFQVKCRGKKMDSKVVFCTLTLADRRLVESALSDICRVSRPAFQFLLGLLSQKPLSFICPLQAMLPLWRQKCSPSLDPRAGPLGPFLQRWLSVLLSEWVLRYFLSHDARYLLHTLSQDGTGTS